MKSLSLLAFLVAIAVVVLGAYTRLVDAGLGCPDWPTCYGHLWIPSTEAEIARANEAFEHAPVETHKTWPEQIHRIFASSLGVLILILFGLATTARKQAGRPWKTTTALLSLLVMGTVLRIFIGHAFDFPLLALAAVYFGWLGWLAKQEESSPKPYKLVALLAGLVILQGWFGMWTVTLNLWPQVVTVHLLGGFTTLSLLWLVFQRTSGWQWQIDSESRPAIGRLQPWIWLFFALVVMQIALGGWTTSNYAALACPDFPTCHAEWWPHADFKQGFNIFQHVGPNYLGGQLDNHARTAIHLTHRIGALLVLLSGLVLIGKLFLAKHAVAQRYAGLISLVLAAQIALGITNVMAGLPLAVAVAHNAGGAVLLLCIITLLQRTYPYLRETQQEKSDV